MFALVAAMPLVAQSTNQFGNLAVAQGVIWTTHTNPIALTGENGGLQTPVPTFETLLTPPATATSSQIISWGSQIVFTPRDVSASVDYVLTNGATTYEVSFYRGEANILENGVPQTALAADGVAQWAFQIEGNTPQSAYVVLYQFVSESTALTIPKWIFATKAPANLTFAVTVHESGGGLLSAYISRNFVAGACSSTNPTPASILNLDQNLLAGLCGQLALGTVPVQALPGEYYFYNTPGGGVSESTQPGDPLGPAWASGYSPDSVSLPNQSGAATFVVGTGEIKVSLTNQQGVFNPNTDVGFHINGSQMISVLDAATEIPLGLTANQGDMLYFVTDADGTITLAVSGALPYKSVNKPAYPTLLVQLTPRSSIVAIRATTYAASGGGGIQR